MWGRILKEWRVGILGVRLGGVMGLMLSGSLGVISRVLILFFDFDFL